VVLVDTPGFMPGTQQEREGLIRHGAKLVHAFAEATVPKLTVVLRKAYGGAFITMNSRDLGAHFVYAWPSAEIGIMGPEQAISIIHRRRLAAATDPDHLKRQLATEYRQEHLHAGSAASDGFVDEVISPDETRSRLSAALTALEHQLGPVGGHGNIPL
jgi:acetyl-CoA carboxylase carboxyltransferase component